MRVVEPDKEVGGLLYGQTNTDEQPRLSYSGDETCKAAHAADQLESSG